MKLKKKQITVAQTLSLVSCRTLKTAFLIVTFLLL